MISTFSIIIIVIYLILIGSLIYGFDKVEGFELQDLEPKTKFSIVIPFRNEEAYLPILLDSISKLNYPTSMFEVILVDDASSDGSVEIIKKNFSKTNFISIIKNKRTSNSPKKDAITSAITIAKNEWILTTDADCMLPNYWLDAFDAYIQTKNPNCVVAPVAYFGNTSFFNRFQALDFLSLQGATVGGFGINQPFLCNGANFGYRKSIFKSINGFDGNSEIASGDDIFLLEKFKKQNPKKVAYLKSDKAIVYTNPVSNFKELIQQRLRWASKTSHNPNGFSKIVGIIVFLGNLICTALIALVLFQFLSPRVAIALFVIKFAIDFLLLFKTTRFLKQENVLFSFITSSLLYPFFSIYIVMLSFFKSYYWKGRTFRK